MMAQFLEKNNIPLPEGARKKEGGSSSENKDICHALVAGYSVFVSSVHSGKLTVRNSRMPSVADFMESLTQEQDKLVQMGTIKSTKDQSVAVGVSKIQGFEAARQAQIFRWGCES